MGRLFGFLGLEFRISESGFGVVGLGFWRTLQGPGLESKGLLDPTGT